MPRRETLWKKEARCNETVYGEEEWRLRADNDASMWLKNTVGIMRESTTQNDEYRKTTYTSQVRLPSCLLACLHEQKNKRNLTARCEQALCLEGMGCGRKQKVAIQNNKNIELAKCVQVTHREY